MIQYVSLLLCLTLPVVPALPSYKVCSLPMNSGSCFDGWSLRWYFNSWNRRCELFHFSCGGNENNFDTEEECRGTCSDTCNLPKEPGTFSKISIRTTRYFYSTTSQRCEKFEYNGYQGNDNNFVSKLECRKVCMNRCTLKPETGFCRAYFPMFFYNTTSGMCQFFVYGGCGGNANRFETKDDCQNQCSDYQIVEVRLNSTFDPNQK